jgi:hypothetical protein
MLATVARHLQRNLVAYIALFFGLAGTSFGAARLVVPPNSVGAKQLKKNAVTAKKLHKNAVTSVKVKDNSLTGRDIAEGTLGKVRTAGNADSAAAAKSANVAGSAVNAINASFLDGVNATGFVRTAQPAGGDLTGLYPNPSIANGAVTPSKLAPAEDWHGVTFLIPAYWGNSGAPNNPVSYMRDQLGFVHLRGVAKNLDSGVGLAGGCGALFNGKIFQLPAGYRPANEEVFANDNSDAFGRLDVTPDGIVCTMSPTAAGGFATLDGITFRAAS